MSKTPLFGVAGNPPNFWKSKYSKERANSPEWLNSIGLDALEIQCTYGVRMPKERAELFKKNSKKFKIKLSIHGPYYISLGTSDKTKIKNSLNEIKKAVELAKVVGANHVIFHLGGIEGTREDSRQRATDALKSLEKTVEFENVRLFPEIAGKVGQLGSFEDILYICENNKYAFPCLDLAHLHARTGGTLYTSKDFEKVFDEVEERLGKEAIENLHIHFYPIELGKGGEKRHKAFFDKKPVNKQLSMLDSNKPKEDRYHPRYEEFLKVIKQRSLSPTIICEARDSQDLGALEMKEYFKKL